jgi:hypothetical protein
MARARARGRALAVATALALHAAVLSVLALGPRVTPPVELPVMQVTLAPPLHRPPPPLSPPKPRSPVRRPLDRAAPGEVAPLPVPPPAPPAPPTADERWRLEAAPFGGEDRVFKAIRLHKRCLDGERLTDWERSKCPVVKPPQPGEQTFAAGAGEKGAAFAKAAEDKARQRRYRDTYSDKTYPGLHCLFGRC